jgi:hypothetical protein
VQTLNQHRLKSLPHNVFDLDSGIVRGSLFLDAGARGELADVCMRTCTLVSAMPSLIKFWSKFCLPNTIANSQLRVRNENTRFKAFGSTCYIILSELVWIAPHLFRLRRPHLRQPHQPPGNAKTLRQHTRCVAFFGFKGGHDGAVSVRSRAPACKCTPNPSLPSVESPLHHSVSTSAIIPQGHSMERCFTLVVRRPARATQTTNKPLLPLLLGTVFSTNLRLLCD